ncbi:MAG: ferritin-like domain-containing protein [Cyclobacteriaceae bacterium]
MTFTNWKEYFETNDSHFSHLDWQMEDCLTKDEKHTISASIKQFQKGENSEGKNLIRYAKAYGDPVYLDTIKLFIREEQTHALVLGKYMQKHGIEKIKQHWVDNIFRGLRKTGTLENSVMVLITAEIIAAIYYKALFRATNSSQLKAICSQILKDEKMHINFQSFTLRQFYSSKNKSSQLLSRGIHRFLMQGTTLVVWFLNRKVLQAGNYSLKSFNRDVFDEFNRSNEMVKGIRFIQVRRPEKRMSA